MSNNLKDLYDKVFEKIKPEIKSLGRGVLYKAIQIILLEDEPNTEQIETLIICNHFNIKSSAFIHEDIDFVYNLRDIFLYTISETDLERGAVKFLKAAKDNLLNDKSKDKKMEELKWIVVVACTVVGAYVCIQYLEKQNKKNNVSKKRQVNRRSDDSQYNAPRTPTPAALCLIVPANIVSSLSNGSPISIGDLSYLIDSASYFICTTKNDADSKERQLTMTNDDIPTESNREVYIRIRISDGNDLIGKKIRYAIKTNLPTNSNFVVENIACLKGLAGIESFNRV